MTRKRLVTTSSLGQAPSEYRRDAHQSGRRWSINGLMGKQTMLFGFAILLVAGGIGFSLKPSKAASASSKSVTVDAVTWRVLSSHTARHIENQYLGSTATGIYLIVNIAATNRSNQPLSLSNNQAELKVKGTEYLPDPSALNALELAGRSTLSLTDLGPANTATGWVAFDVAPSAISSNPRLCFHGIGVAGAQECVATG
jgi:hypothetical protein